MRKIRIQGFGYNSPSQSEIEIKLDGEIMYRGPVHTVEVAPGDKYPTGYIDGEYHCKTVVEWDQSLDAASRQLEIIAVSGNFRFTNTDSNYMPLRPLNNRSTIWSTGPDVFLSCYDLQESENAYYRDSNHDVRIDGQPQSRNSSNESERLGQHYWSIEQGQKFSSTMLISQGLASPIYECPKVPWKSDDRQMLNLDDFLIWQPNHILLMSNK